MAELDPYAPQEGGGNYLGYSRGTVPDSSVGGLFSDAANIVTSASRAGSQYFQQAGREEFTQAADEIRDTFTGRRTFDAQAPQSRVGALGPDSPQELRDYGQRLEALSQAYASGRVRESHYWTLLDVEARKVRQRYPGFRAEIDGMIKDVVGADPANKLVQELQSEAMTRGRSAQQDHEQWLREATRLGTSSALNYQTLAGQGRAPTTLQLQNEVATVQSEIRRREAEGAFLQQESQRGQNMTERAQRSFRGALDFQYRTVFNAATGQFAQNRGDFEQALNRAVQASQSGQISQRDVMELSAQWNGLRGQALNNAQAMLHTPVNPHDPASQTWAQMIGNSEKVKSVIDEHMASFDAVGDALNNKDWGLISFLKRSVEATEAGETNALYQRSDVLRHYGALRQILGPQFMTSGLLSSSNQTHLNEVLSTVIAPGAVGVASGTSNLNQVLGQVQRNPGLTTDQRNGSAREIVQRSVAHLGQRDMPVEAVRLAAQGMFTNGGVSLSQFGNRSEVYMQLAGSPEVVANMVRLRDSGHEGARLFQEYKTWTLTNFSSLMREQGQSLQGMVLNNAHNELRFDPETFTFSLSPVRAGDPTGGHVTEGERAAMNKINQTIQGVRSLVRATVDNPQEERAVIATAIRGLNVDLSRSRSSQGSIWEAMQLALQKLPGAIPPTTGPRAEGGMRPEQVAPLLDVIGRGEGGTNGYNAVFDGQMRGTANPNLTNMTIAEVQALQRQTIGEQRRNGIQDGVASSAVGKYQFIQNALNETVKELGLDPKTTVFSAQVQDQMAMHQLKKMGLDQYLANPTPEGRNRLIDRMSSFWAALPNSSGTGRGNLDGVGRNRANRSPAEINKVLDELIERYSGGR